MKPAIRTNKRRRGQGMTEYIIIVALIAIASIGVITLFGDQIRTLFGQAADALYGDPNVAHRGAKSSTKLEKKNLGNYAQNNNALP